MPTGTALTAGTPERAAAPTSCWAGSATLDAGMRRLVLDRTPLWYFVLCEAEARGGGGTRLGPLGARIVAGQLIGLLHGDDESYLTVRPDWTSRRRACGRASRRWPTSSTTRAGGEPH